MKIYVGNLPYDVTKEDLQAEFTAFGAVSSVEVIMDKYSGRPKGFAFVEMGSKAEADAAIAGLSGKTLKERTLTVNEARPRESGSFGANKRPGGGYNSGRGGRPGGGGRGGYSGGGGRRRF